MDTNSKQSTVKTHSKAASRIIGILLGLFAFIWLPTPDVDAALQLISPPDCELADPRPCSRTDKVTVFRWTRSESPRVHSYRVIFSDLRDFSNGIILELSEFENKRIIAPQVALNLGKFFDSSTDYYWRVVALDKSGVKVEESQETFAFYYFLDASEFTVISGLVNGDFHQAALVGARVAVSSEGHKDTRNSSIKIAFNREFIVIARTTDFNSTAVPFPIEITSTKEGFRPTTKSLDDPAKLNGVELLMISEFDGDGISDAVENASPCLDYDDADTDDDGIADGDEDTNKNGVKDFGETDPCRLDTDNDGIQDGTELGLKLDDIGPDTDTVIFQPDLDPSTKTNPLEDDSDNDGLPDGKEDTNHNGRVDDGETEPGFPNVRALPHILPLLLAD